jgi:hypothetical protein
MAAAEQTAEFDPALGALALGQFQTAPDSGSPAYLSGKNLREGLLSSLFTAEMLAASAGVVPWYDLGGGQRGIAVLGAARERIDQAPESVRTIYLAAHGAARQAQANARGAASGLDLRVRTDGGLAKVTGSGELGDIGAFPLVFVVLGVAAIVAAAWFAKESVGTMVQTRGANLRASYAADTAAKIAMAQIAAGQQVDPSVYGMLGELATSEKSAPTVLPLVLIAGGVGLVGGAAWLLMHGPIRAARMWADLGSRGQR